jgi:hypothetical protein
MLNLFRKFSLTVLFTCCSDPYGFASVRDSVEDVNALALWKDPDTEALGVDNQSYSFLPQSPRKSHGLVPHCLGYPLPML